MRNFVYSLFLCFFFLQSCAQEAKPNKSPEDQSEETKEQPEEVLEEEFEPINPSGTTLETRILPPTNYQRTEGKQGTYAHYLRNLPLKPEGAKVKYYDGDTKPNLDTYVAVVDLKIGDKDLHQCADAVMRLRAEYLWTQKRYDEIHFNFTNGFQVDYSNWMQGQRMVIKGNKTYWTNRNKPSNTYEDFWNYMELIFTYAGTLSLSKELEPVPLAELQIGDVFIYGASPGHAVLVADVVKHNTTGEKLFLLAQSYMPAQETQILQNPNNPDLSPWYSLSEISGSLVTPEWTFTANELKRFKE